MPVVTTKPEQYIPKVETLTPQNVQQELAKANLGKSLSAIATTVAALQGGAAPVVPGDAKKLRVALDLAHRGGLVQGMMATAFPRESIAKALAQRFVERAQTNPAIVAGVAQMLGAPSTTPAAQLAGPFAWAVSAQVQEKMIESKGMQDTMKKAMGYQAMDAPSKTKVDALIKKYMAVVGDPKLDRAALDKKLEELNDEAKKTEVNFPSLNWKGLITHVPSQGSRDVLLGVDGAQWSGLRPAFDVLDKSLGT
jgi:hypothetical protein